MPVLLDGFDFRTAGPQLIDFGGELVPGIGAAVQRINRLGNRFGIAVEMPPVPEEPEGRILAGLLRLAKTQGALFPFPQPGLEIGVPGSPVVNGTVAGGTSLPVRGLTALYTVRFGQFFSIIHGGRRYLHSAAAETTANGSGNAVIVLDPTLRTDLADGDVVEMAEPKIEGLLETGNVKWAIRTEPFTDGLGFTVTESR
jgi:hypothetical protein